MKEWAIVFYFYNPESELRCKTKLLQSDKVLFQVKFFQED